MIYNVFYVSLLEQNITKKGQVNKKTLLKLQRELEFEAGDNQEYEVKAIMDNTVYGL